MGVVACVGLVLYGGGVDGDTSGFFLWSLVDGGVLMILRFVFGAEVLGDGGCECGFTVIDMTDGAD